MSNNGHEWAAELAEGLKALPKSIQGPPPGVDWSMAETIPLSVWLGSVQDEIPKYTWYPLVRDTYLRDVWKAEPILAGAVYSMAARIDTLDFEITGKPRAQKHYQAVIGRFLRNDLKRWIIDYLTQDNGAFIEKVGAGRADGPLRGPVVELRHLDSLLCWRTHDAEYPVLYTNPYTGTLHKLHHTRVIARSSMTAPDELARGVGFCAVSRALQLSVMMRDINRYMREKVSGKFTRAIGYGTGITAKQFSQALQSSTESLEALGVARYAGIVFLLSQREDMKLGLLDLASLPDGFDFTDYTTLYVYALSLAFGVDAREFWPATASGATKADATVQHMKAKGKGIGDLIQTVERLLNWDVLEDVDAEFAYDYTDDEDDLLAAQVHAVRAQNLLTYQNAGWINAQEARALAIYHGLLDEEVLADLSESLVADASAPIDQAPAEPAPAEPAPAQPGQPGPTSPPEDEAEEPEDEEEDEDEGKPAQKQVDGGPLYVSLRLASVCNAQVANIQTALADQIGVLPGIVWQPADTFHVTLAYAPDAPDSAVVAVRNWLQEHIGDDVRAPALEVSAIAAFDTPDGAALHLRVRNNADLAWLQAGIVGVFDALGVPVSEHHRPDVFQPHITLCYMPKGTPFPANSMGVTLWPEAVQIGREDYRQVSDQLFVKALKQIQGDPSEQDGAVDAYAQRLERLILDMQAEGKFQDPARYAADVDELTDRYVAALETGLSEAYGIGLAGETASGMGLVRLQRVADTSYRFFRDSFAPALLAMLTGGGAAADVASFVPRLRQYAGAYWESMWEGLGDWAEQRSRAGRRGALRVQRVLDPVAAHCTTCPPKARIYESFEDMRAVAGVPGDGSDDCLTNCRCRLVVELEPGSGVFVPITGAPSVFTGPLIRVRR